LDPDPQRLEDISSIRDAMRQIGMEAQAVVELLDARIEDEHLDGSTEAEDVRTVLELIQNLSLEVSEELDAYQQRHAS
jgi:predicted transcriptional regulator